MFDAPRWLDATCTVTIPRVIDIRNCADLILDRVKAHYGPCLRAEIADEIEPEFPRLVIPSIHGNSQIHASQVMLGLQVRFTADWQVSPTLGRQYVHERARLLRSVVPLLPEAHAKFVGVGFRIHLPWKGSDEEVIQRIAQTYASTIDTRELYDVEVKRVVVVDGKYFNNVTVRNYRGFPPELMKPDVRSLSRGKANVRGVEIVVDFNDRHSFNERADYRSADHEIDEALAGALDAAAAAVRLFETSP